MRRYIDIIESADQDEVYVHYSATSLPVGTVLTPRSGHWWRGGWAAALERHRPAHMIPLAKAVFMFADHERHQTAGGEERKWRFEVEPLGPVERHDAQWAFDLDAEMDGDNDPDTIRQYANNYWRGVASGEDRWEYLTTSARIVAVSPV